MLPTSSTVTKIEGVEIGGGALQEPFCSKFQGTVTPWFCQPTLRIPAKLSEHEKIVVRVAGRTNVVAFDHTNCCGVQRTGVESKVKLRLPTAVFPKESVISQTNTPLLVTLVRFAPEMMPPVPLQLISMDGWIVPEAALQEILEYGPAKLNCVPVTTFSVVHVGGRASP